MKISTHEQITYISKKGLKDLKREIKQLNIDLKKSYNKLRSIDRSGGREERLERIEQLSIIENIENKLIEKKSTLENSRILPHNKNRFQVAIGSVVELIDRQGRKSRYKLVESIEANPSDGRISTVSPLGQSLLGRTVKETVVWNSGKTMNKMQLVNIY